MKKNGVTKGLNAGRRFEVLLEEIRHNLKTVAEGHSMLASKLEEHDEKLEEINTKLEAINTMIRKIDANYFKLQMDTESIKSQTGTIDIKLDRIERELGTVKNTSMDASSITKEHERRITKLEEKVFV